MESLKDLEEQDHGRWLNGREGVKAKRGVTGASRGKHSVENSK